jgi:hypothetical protein
MKCMQNFMRFEVLYSEALDCSPLQSDTMLFGTRLPMLTHSSEETWWRRQHIFIVVLCILLRILDNTIRNFCPRNTFMYIKYYTTCFDPLGVIFRCTILSLHSSLQHDIHSCPYVVVPVVGLGGPSIMEGTPEDDPKRVKTCSVVFNIHKSVAWTETPYSII